MAQGLQYLIEFQGLDASIAKLTTLDSLITRINSKAGTIGGVGGATNNNVTSHGGHLQTAAILTLNAQMAMLGNHLRNVNKVIANKVPTLPPSQVGNAPGGKPPYLISPRLPFTKGTPFAEQVNNLYSSGASDLKSSLLRVAAKKSYVNYYVSHISDNLKKHAPPYVHPTNDMGGMVGLNPFFSPQFWRPLIKDLQSAFRVLKETFAGPIWGLPKGNTINSLKKLFGRGETNGAGQGPIFGVSPFGPNGMFSGIPMQGFGGMKEKFGHLFSGQGLRHLGRAAGVPREFINMILAFSKLGVVIGAVIVSLYALVKGVEAASKAYQDAAKQGLSVAQSQNINNAFASLGMSTPDLSKIQYMLGKGNDTEAILNAARGGQLGESGQQLLNMADDFRAAMKDGEESAKQMQAASKAGQQLSMDGIAIGREWKTFMAQFAAENYAWLHLLLSGVKNLLKIINDFNAIIITGQQLIGMTPVGGENQQQFTGAAKSGIAANTSFEKLGFVMKGPSPEKNLTDINRNTAQSVSWLAKIGALIALQQQLAFHNGTALPGLP